MSRIGKQFIALPSGVTVQIENNQCTVTGPKGSLSEPLLSGITIKVDQDQIKVERTSDEPMQRAYHGLFRTLLRNMVVGVTEGFTKQLEIQGVGYRASLTGTDLQLSLGYSHPVLVTAPEGITFKVEKNIISVSGINKTQVGEVAANIRERRKPEPYKGKGIRYVGEMVRRKAGKTAKA